MMSLKQRRTIVRTMNNQWPIREMIMNGQKQALSYTDDSRNQCRMSSTHSLEPMRSPRITPKWRVYEVMWHQLASSLSVTLVTLRCTKRGEERVSTRSDRETRSVIEHSQTSNKEWHLCLPPCQITNSMLDKTNP